MPTLASELMPDHFDEDGFLKEPEIWSERLAQQIAENDGLGPLADAHWEVIACLREHYLKSGALMPPSHVCWVNHLGRYCVQDLFGSTREAWRVAGLPNPGEEAKAYM
jgi:TusE/DsrC/DsvC family sulfur relay protein